jgi:hypothetical protein
LAKVTTLDKVNLFSVWADTRDGKQAAVATIVKYLTIISAIADKTLLNKHSGHIKSTSTSD